MTALNRHTTIKWLGHATFQVLTPEGKTVLIDPWVMNNPACPQEAQNFDKIDLMLITHGHFDHIGDAVELARRYEPKVVAIYETAHWLESKGVKNILPMNKGGTQVIDNIRVTMVHADHSCGILDDGRIIYGGEGVGYVVELENGFRLYHAGDTAVFGDMKLIGELYRPELAMIPVGDLYTMGPREAAHAIRLLDVKKVIPMHFGTFPALTGTVADLKELTADIAGLEIIEMKPGESVS
ncbi:MAG: metal-dependent hydrolase [Acidobacteria bacterium]|nr:MAG: metal-dependent hydrolase [Acidobacteriota bacterium]